MDIYITTGSDNKKSSRNKGRSLIEFPENYTIIDIETTGLSPKDDSIIDLGACKVRNGKIVDRFSQLVNPGFPISVFIEDLTGITNDMLSCAPPIETALENFFNFVGDDILVGHNVNFDINFIYDNAERCFSKLFQNDFVDTLRISRRLFPDFPNHKLETLIKKFNINAIQEHRALSDCNITYDCFQYMKQYCVDCNVNPAELRSRKTPNPSCDNTIYNFSSTLSTTTIETNDSGQSTPTPKPIQIDHKSKSSRKTIVLILAIFLGYLGIHRFYVGKIGTGIIWLCTGGCFAVGWIYDIIKIASGTFRDGAGQIIK